MQCIIFCLGEPVSVVYVAPSVTPWTNDTPDKTARNPAVRLYQYNRKTARITDIQQYYLNLDAANTQLSATWQLEYKLTADFGVKDATPHSYHQLLQTFKLSNSRAFEKFYVYNGVSYNRPSCDMNCKGYYLCSMQYLDYKSHSDCLSRIPRILTPSVKDDSDLALPMFAVVLSLVVLVVLVILLLSYCHRFESDYTEIRNP